MNCPDYLNVANKLLQRHQSYLFQAYSQPSDGLPAVHQQNEKKTHHIRTQFLFHFSCHFYILFTPPSRTNSKRRRHSSPIKRKIASESRSRLTRLAGLPEKSNFETRDGRCTKETSDSFGAELGTEYGSQRRTHS